MIQRKPNKICQRCKQEYKCNTTIQKYCQGCGYEAMKEKNIASRLKNKNLKKICVYCKKEFMASKTQQACGISCAIRNTTYKRVGKYLEEDKLKKQADRLFQEVGKIKYPKSIISGEPTEVIHHFVYKSQSNNTRYEMDNAIPLTIKEHDTIHNRPARSELTLTITSKKGRQWQIRLLNKSRIIRKLTKDYLREVIEKLKANKLEV